MTENEAMKKLEEIQQYRTIGTIAECRRAVKRRMAKKPNNRKLLRDFNNVPYSIYGDCPFCRTIGLLSVNTDYCNVAVNI